MSIGDNGNLVSKQNCQKNKCEKGHFAFWAFCLFPFLQVGCDLDIQKNLTCNDPKHEKQNKKIVWIHKPWHKHPKSGQKSILAYDNQLT